MSIRQKLEALNPFDILTEPHEWSKWWKDNTGCPMSDSLDYADRRKKFAEIQADKANAPSVVAAMRYLLDIPEYVE